MISDNSDETQKKYLVSMLRRAAELSDALSTKPEDAFARCTEKILAAMHSLGEF